MYSPYINRFTQPDTLIPDPSNPQAWNRYSYVLNNPIRYNDPTGHCFSGLGIDTVACVDIVIIGGLAILAVATVYLIITPPEKVRRDIENIGPVIDRFERNFEKNAGEVSAVISDSVTHLAAGKLDPTKPAENILPGSLKRKFPTGLLGRSLNEIEEALKNATGKEKSDLKTAKKILEQVKRLLQKPK